MAIRILFVYFRENLIKKSLASASAFYLTCILVLFSLSPMIAQSEVQAGSVEFFQKEKLSDVLLQLSKTRNLNFSYDASNPVYEKQITIDAKGISTDKLLAEFFLNTGVQFKQIGNQIVLFQAGDSQAETLPEAPAPVLVDNKIAQATEQEVLIGLPATQYEYRLDTVFLHDTIVRIDTIRLTDTVFIEKSKPENQNPAKIKKIPVDFFQTNQVRDEGWAMDVFAAPLLSDFSLVDEQKSFSLRSFSLGFDALKMLNRWNISAGMRLTQFDQKFTQKYSQTEGGYYLSDTIDAYYTVIGMDTTWYYVTDSSWIPQQTTDYSYQQTNTLGYLEFNVSASFDVFQNQKIRVYLKAGGQLSFLIYENGIAVPDKNEGEGVDFSNLQFNSVNYAFLVGSGLKYRIGDKVDFNTELYYSGYLDALVPDFPFDTKINAVGLKFGLVFYF